MNLHVLYDLLFFCFETQRLRLYAVLVSSMSITYSVCSILLDVTVLTISVTVLIISSEEYKFVFYYSNVSKAFVTFSLTDNKDICYVTNRKVAGSRPDEVNDFYQFT
jgi:hypothetical protein